MDLLALVHWPAYTVEMDWGKLVFEARSRLGVSQAEMGERLGISQATVSQMERGLGPDNKPGAWRPSWELGERIRKAHEEATKQA